MSRPRRNFTAEQKAEIVRRHVAGKEPVSKLAEELQVQPTLIHAWVNQVLTQAARAFERSAGNGRVESGNEARIEHLETKLAQMSVGGLNAATWGRNGRSLG